MRVLCLSVCAVLSTVLWADIPGPYATKVTPRVASYRIPADLSGVRHMEKVKDLKAAQRKALATRGFVVCPDTAEQMFELYEEYGEDPDEGPVPNFITVDSLLQAYHIFFDFSLRTVETQYLAKYATELTQLMLAVTVRQLQQAPPGPVQEAAGRNLAYFLVARKVLTGQAPGITANVPGKAQIIALANAELPKIAAHEGRFLSELMGRTLHYDQFNPRGHYTRSEALKRYFMGMMWYGNLGFYLEADAGELARRHSLQALLIARALSQNEWGASLWQRIYEPTQFFVGGADDLTWEQYLPLARRAFGDDLPLTALGDENALDKFLSEARATFPAPRIAPALLEADASGQLEPVAAKPQGREFRFMGQRFIPDSYMLQQLVYPKVGEDPNWRYWPKGLDVMAVLGSTRARRLLLDRFKEDRFAHYVPQLDGLIREFAQVPEERWWQNLYWGWLASLQPLLAEKGDGYPGFMRSSAWLDKELMTAQGSWSQLRHDTILYGKPSGAELGAAEPAAVQGYVEPYPEVFGRLAYLTHLSASGLKDRGLLSGDMSEAYKGLEEVLMFLKGCAEKELRGEALSAEDYERIQWFGGELERIQLNGVEGGSELQYWGEITNEADRFMSTIADIHTSFDQCLEVGVGLAHRIYVIVPHPKGGLQVAKGGVMSYYEFTWPVSDRLTDEKWIEMLTSGKAPAMPEWTSSFIVK
jgi:hypothetical protein